MGIPEISFRETKENYLLFAYFLKPPNPSGVSHHPLTRDVRKKVSVEPEPLLRAEHSRARTVTAIFKFDSYCPVLRIFFFKFVTSLCIQHVDRLLLHCSFEMYERMQHHP